MFVFIKVYVFFIMYKYDNSFLQIKFLRILLYGFLRVASEAVSVLFYWCPIKVFLASRLNLLAIFLPSIVLFRFTFHRTPIVLFTQTGLHRSATLFVSLVTVLLFRTLHSAAANCKRICGHRPANCLPGQAMDCHWCNNRAEVLSPIHARHRACTRHRAWLAHIRSVR